MFRVYIVGLLLCLSVVWGGEVKSFIVLTQEATQEAIEAKQRDYEALVAHDSATRFLLEQERLPAKIIKLESNYLLKVGPFDDSDTLAIVYLTIKDAFPQSFIMEHTEPQIKEVKQEVIKEIAKEDVILWIAIFGLAVVGILFMYLSSDEIKRLKMEYQKLKQKHQRLEEKQHEVLSTMGENIHAMTKETIDHTKELASQVKDAPLHSKLEKVMDHENELLDITGELIGFLRLKSKKVVMQDEVFRFNNVLNDVTGVLSTLYGKNDAEVLFDIDKGVPHTMRADSLHLGQVLMNMLEYVIEHSSSKEVKLNIVRDSRITERLKIKFTIESDLVLQDQEKLFEYYYDEQKRRYVGLGLYMAKEYIYLMGGILHIEKTTQGTDSFVFTLPMKEERGEKRKTLKSMVGQRVLIVDRSALALEVTQRLVTSFKVEIETMSNSVFEKMLPDLKSYGLVILNEQLFTPKTLDVLENLKKHHGIKVMRLRSIFSSYPMTPHYVIDSELSKPMNYDYLYDTFKELYEREGNTPPATPVEKANLLPIHREEFVAQANMSIEKFARFKGKYLLIVEDNKINQKVLLNILNNSGMVLYTVDNGKEAVDFLQQRKEAIDFVLMDINMPTMDGYRAVELIRSDARFDTMPIVALTALVLSNEIEKMFECGMNGYLPKPVKIEKLYSALDYFLQKQKGVNTIRKEQVVRQPMVLEGLDIEAGIKRMRGNEALYKELLLEFSDAYSGSDVLFEKLVQEKRYEQAKMLCLDMIGLTGTIGAKKMHFIISEIHQYLVNKHPELIHAYIDRYKEELGKLIGSIKTYV